MTDRCVRLWILGHLLAIGAALTAQTTLAPSQVQGAGCSGTCVALDQTPALCVGNQLPAGWHVYVLTMMVVEPLGRYQPGDTFPMAVVIWFDPAIAALAPCVFHPESPAQGVVPP